MDGGSWHGGQSAAGARLERRLAGGGASRRAYVLRTTSLRGTQYEVLHVSRGRPAGAFDAQGIGSVPDVKLERRLEAVDAETVAKVEDAVRAWLAL